MIVETISLRDLVHHRQVRAVLAPASLRRIVDQSRDEPVGFAPTLAVLAIEDDGDDVVHFPHADDEGPDEVQPGFFAPSPAELVLLHAVVAADFGDRAEEQVGAVGEPVDPFQLGCAGDPLECVVPGLEHYIVRHVFWLKVFGTWDAFEERVFDDAQESVAHGLWSVDGSVEIPASQVEFLRYRVHLVVCQWFV